VRAADAIVDSLKQRKNRASRDTRSHQAANNRLVFQVVMKEWGHNNVMARVRKFSGLAVLVLLAPAMAQTNTPPFDPADFKIPLWHTEVQLRGSLGYKDNITLSSTEPESSGFWMTGLEGILFRLPSGGWQFNALLDVTDVRYFSSPSVDNEQMVVVVSELTRDLGHDWKSACGLNYLFQNQVFDMSATYTDPTAIGQVVGHALTPRWRVRKELRPFWIEGELSATRQLLDEPLDDYWQYGPRLSVGRSLGLRSEISLAYQWLWLDYDSREQVDAGGLALTNTSLALQTHLVELNWTQTWDEKRRWQTSTRAGLELNHDNGSGFYDYRNFRLSEELRYRAERWEAKARARVSHYDYLAQPVSADDPSRRERTLIALMLLCERTLSRRLKVFANYTWEKSISNLSFDNYHSSLVTGGFAVTF